MKKIEELRKTLHKAYDRLIEANERNAQEELGLISNEISHLENEIDKLINDFDTQSYAFEMSEA